MRKSTKTKKVVQDKLTPEQCKQLSIKLRKQGSLSEAEAYSRQALKLAPVDAEAHNLLGNTLKAQYRLTEAITYYQQALALQPRYAAAFSNLGLTYLERGNQRGALEAYRIALQLEPTILRYENLLLGLQFASGISAAEIAQAHFNFERLFMAHLPRVQRIARMPTYPLRIGYVSGDFYQQSCAFFIKPFLQYHDPEQFHLTCYYNNQHQDDITILLKGYVERWVNCATLTDEQLTKKIVRDQIDILVDLSGHTPLNRLGVFARAPAPIQLTYIGYPNTTGLSTMNYRLVNHRTDPVGMTERWTAEQLIRLPESYCCYDPLMPLPDVTELPTLRNGYVTFASFAKLDKVNEFTFQLWCEVLRAIPTAHFKFHGFSFQDVGTRKLWLDHFAKAGIDPQRLTISYLPSFFDVLQTYQMTDMVLDTYPFNGVTTTCQALSMGVPVITLAGETTVSRVGLDLLHTVGLADFVATQSADYVAIAQSLAQNLAYLQTIRATLRSRLLSSPLADGQGFTQALEDIYRTLSMN